MSNLFCLRNTNNSLVADGFSNKKDAKVARDSYAQQGKFVVVSRSDDHRRGASVVDIQGFAVESGSLKQLKKKSKRNRSQQLMKAA